MKITIEICMGSSCFARGNDKLLPLIEEFIKSQKLEDEIELTGLRCEERCKEGPNLRINGRLYQRMDAGTLTDLLEELTAR